MDGCGEVHPMRSHGLDHVLSARRVQEAQESQEALFCEENEEKS